MEHSSTIWIFQSNFNPGSVYILCWKQMKLDSKTEMQEAGKQA